MKISSLEELFHDEIKDLYSAESQLLKALPKMAKAASSDQLREAFESHLEETRGHVERLEEIGTSVGLKLTGKKCKAMEGLVEEGSEVIDADGEEPVLDLALISAAQRVEHYEISAYGSLRTLAEFMGKVDAVQLLQETQDEESAADEKLTQIAQAIYPTAGGEQGDEMDEEETPRSKGKSNGKSAAKTKAARSSR
jgi:ferritin-like metal-binding protein YciE